MEKELEEERNKSVHTNSSQQEKAMTAVMPADISKLFFHFFNHNVELS